MDAYSDSEGAQNWTYSICCKYVYCIQIVYQFHGIQKLRDFSDFQKLQVYQFLIFSEKHIEEQTYTVSGHISLYKILTSSSCDLLFGSLANSRLHHRYCEKLIRARFQTLASLLQSAF